MNIIPTKLKKKKVYALIVKDFYTSRITTLKIIQNMIFLLVDSVNFYIDNACLLSPNF